MKGAQGYPPNCSQDNPVITPIGNRNGSGNAENGLSKHPAVALAPTISTPDPLRTEWVRAFLVPKEGPSPARP